MANKPAANRFSKRLYRGDRVLVAKDLGDSMRHFSGAGEEAIVLGSYGDLCHGDDHGSYSLLFKDGNSCSWYHREQLTKKGKRATEEEMEDLKATGEKRRERESKRHQKIVQKHARTDGSRWEADHKTKAYFEIVFHSDGETSSEESSAVEQWCVPVAQMLEAVLILAREPKTCSGRNFGLYMAGILSAMHGDKEGQ